MNVKPKVGYRYLHHSGTKYKVLMLTNVMSSSAKFIPTVVYQSDLGMVWSRPIVDFLKHCKLVGESDNEA